MSFQLTTPSRFLQRASMALVPALSVLTLATMPALSQVQAQEIYLAQAPTDATQQESPSISDSSCDTAFAQLKQSLIGDRQLSVPYESEGEPYGDSPEGRSIMYIVAVEGPAATAVLTSPQLLQGISQAFIENCDSAASVSVGLYRTGEKVVFGMVDGRVAPFSCAEDLGMQPGPRGIDRPMPWGYHYCSL